MAGLLFVDQGYETQICRDIGDAVQQVNQIEALGRDIAALARKHWNP